MQFGSNLALVCETQGWFRMIQLTPTLSFINKIMEYSSVCSEIGSIR